MVGTVSHCCICIFSLQFGKDTFWWICIRHSVHKVVGCMHLLGTESHHRLDCLPGFCPPHIFIREPFIFFLPMIYLSTFSTSRFRLLIHIDCLVCNNLVANLKTKRNINKPRKVSRIECYHQKIPFILYIQIQITYSYILFSM